jgi:GT2 family glycosyltransferase
MVSVVIPAFNQVHLTERCLTSLLANSRAVKEIFVINNASQDETRATLEKFEPQFLANGISFKAIHNEKNVGFGRACNQGIREATQNYVAILNNDTWVMPAWDEALMKALEKNSLDFVGPYFDEKPLTENMVERASAFVQKNGGKIRDHFVPILMFFSRSAVGLIAFDHGGIFDERFFVTYEDTDLKHRMNQAGLKFAQSSDCYIWHHSMGTRSKPGLLPAGYEAEGLNLFMEKWGFDPRPQEHTFSARLRRRIWKIKEKWGLF